MTDPKSSYVTMAPIYWIGTELSYMSLDVSSAMAPMHYLHTCLKYINTDWPMKVEFLIPRVYL